LHLTAGSRVATVWTSGYEQHPEPGSLVASLQAAGVRRLVDVRELPLSRRPGFSKTALAEALGHGRIAYEHARALGNPKPCRDLWRSGRRDEGECCYRAHLAGEGRPAVVELAASLRAAPTCLLCLEASHRDCHRSVVAEALARLVPGLAVVNL
jgi:uncharacterized protein (DUF488 family)